MEVRTLLYGYNKHQFRFLINETESAVVKGIFDEYISGGTLQKIADRLTAENIVYYKDKTVWNKHMVRRILENPHYTGDDEYPAIVDKAVFERANEIRLKKCGTRENDSEREKYFKYHTVCGQCGGRFTRRRNWSRTREKWFCTCGCKSDTYIDDTVFYGQIRSVLRRVIENSDVLIVPPKAENTYAPSLEVLRAEKETDRMAERKSIDFMPIKKAIYSNISDKFDCCTLDTAKAFNTVLAYYFGKMQITEEINLQVLRDTVDKIIVSKDGTVTVRFINGAEISKDKENSNGNGCDSTETENNN